TSGYDIRRKLWYAEKAQADPDTSADWTQFTAIGDNTTFNNAKAALLAYLKERTGGTVPISLKMTWEEVAQAPAFTGLLNESYGSGAEAAYSTRRLNGNVTECMVIRRASDSTTTTIGFDGSGNIDESAIETFCTGTTCTVVTWKDQSGNGNDATAAAQTNEPTIYTGGALVKEGGKVAVEFDGNDDELETTATFSLTQPVHQFGTGRINTSYSPSTNYTFASSDVETNRNHFFYRSTGKYAIYSGSSIESSIDTNSMQFVFSGLFNSPSSQLHLNGTSVLSGDSGSYNFGGNLLLGNQSADFPWYGVQQEFIFYPSDKSSVRTSIESNIGDYFTQNTPLLDTYSGAAAAYSLRLLDSTYTGSAVEVYNGSSYADIGFNVFGELDTVALAAHCGSNDGFVSKWYDQASSNDATQTVTGSMPKIYDGTTGVITENGKPAVSFDGSNDGLSSASFTTIPQPLSYISVNKQDTTQLKFLYGSATNVLARSYTSNGTWKINSGTELFGASTNANQNLLMNIHNGSNSAQFFNGVSAASGDSGTAGTDGVYIGISQAGTIPFDGVIQELILYPSDQSSNRTNIEDNINTFYNIY
ncbi:MAG: arabinofuranosidase catalytic domain-containing protein, partial [Alphaproteobacteria bacterium]